MDNQNDTLSDFEIKEKGNGLLFYTTVSIYGALIIAFVIDSFRPFSTFPEKISIDSELQMLVAMHVIFPCIALGLFINKKSLGWSLIVLSSIINATYGVFAYANDLLSSPSPMQVLNDKMLFFFLAHITILFLIFRKSLVDELNLSRKYFLYMAVVSILVSVSFLLLLFTTYH